jgi:hypothetical protein
MCCMCLNFAANSPAGCLSVDDGVATVQVRQGRERGSQHAVVQAGRMSVPSIFIYMHVDVYIDTIMGNAKPSTCCMVPVVPLVPCNKLRPAHPAAQLQLTGARAAASSGCKHTSWPMATGHDAQVTVRSSWMHTSQQRASFMRHHGCTTCARRRMLAGTPGLMCVGLLCTADSYATHCATVAPVAAATCHASGWRHQANF